VDDFGGESRPGNGEGDLHYFGADLCNSLLNYIHLMSVAHLSLELLCLSASFPALALLVSFDWFYFNEYKTQLHKRIDYCITTNAANSLLYAYIPAGLILLADSAINLSQSSRIHLSKKTHHH